VVTVVVTTALMISVGFAHDQRAHRCRGLGRATGGRRPAHGGVGGVFGVLAERTSDQHVDATAPSGDSVRMLDERSRAPGGSA
jgi:hypothetical protein